MAIQTVGWALAQELPPEQKLVLVVLGDLCDGRGTCWPSLEMLAARTGVDTDRARELLLELVERDLIDTSDVIRLRLPESGGT